MPPEEICNDNRRDPGCNEAQGTDNLNCPSQQQTDLTRRWRISAGG